jgi:hypothetical protein
MLNRAGRAAKVGLLPGLVACLVVASALLVPTPQGAIKFACYGYGVGGYGLCNPPTITSVSNNEGPLFGGTTVTIDGTDFNNFLVGGAPGVLFGSTPALRSTYISDTRIVAVSPIHASGVLDVRVTTSAGISPITPRDKFTFTGAKYCATYENEARAPRTWVKGTSQTFTITVSNCGTVTWPMTGTARIDLNMHFTTKRGGIFSKSFWLTRGFFHITRKLPTNRSTVITVTLKPTFTSSGLWLESTMIRETHYYFEQTTHHPTQWSAVFVTVS